MSKWYGCQRLALLGAASAMALASAHSAAAQEVANGEAQPTNQQSNGESAKQAASDGNEILVTAQRRQENLQDVPISIAVLSGEELDSSTGKGIGDALRGVPSVFTTQDMFLGGSITVSVRGVSAAGPRAVGSGVSAFYLDGVPYGFLRSAYVPDPSVYDLDRVEILRGPQGTLYGAGSLNGAVRVLTHSADVDNFDFKARSYVSTTRAGGENVGGDFSVNMPVVPGLLGVRATVTLKNDSGWVDSYVPVSPATVPSTQSNVLSKKDINDSDVGSYRLKLRAEPSDTLSLDFTLWHYKNEIGGPNQSDENRRVSSIRPQDQSAKFTTYALSLGKEFAAFSLDSTTSYINFRNKGDAEGTHVGANGVLFGDWTSEVFSQEINFVSSTDGPWRWSAGAIYRDAEESTYQFFNLNSGGGFAFNDYIDRSKSYAVYGEVAFDLTESLDLAAGLRYFHDDAALVIGLPFSNPATGISYPVGQEFTSVSKAWTPRIVLTYKPSTDQTIYASYSQGFRSGLAQLANVQAAAPFFGPLKPDRLINYEIGNKGRLGALVVYEAAVYYIDWRNRQDAFQIILPNRLSVLAQVNATSGSGFGAEFAVTAEPLPGFDLSAAVGWSGLKNDADIINGSGVILRPKGGRFDASPEWTLAVTGAYRWELGNGFSANANAGVNYQSPGSATPLPSPIPGFSKLPSDDLWDVNARFAIENDRWTAAIFGDNLTDEKGRISINDLVAPEWGQRRRPRTFGLQVEYKY